MRLANIFKTGFATRTARLFLLVLIGLSVLGKVDTGLET